MDYIKTMINDLDLSDCVDVVGFVSEDRLNDLYATCGLFVFPTLIGPDNLPPLEAIAHGAPLLISRFPGSVEQMGDAAKYFDPLDSNELANLMLLSIERPEAWLENQEIAGKIRATRRYDAYLNRLFSELEKLSTLRSVWP
jgi:glycosyltransferase involved in cell wall biosynthesis